MYFGLLIKISETLRAYLSISVFKEKVYRVMCMRSFGNLKVKER